MANDQRPTTNDRSLQETYAPHNACFGCGPANQKGLRIRSFAVSDREAVAEWRAAPHHEAFPGMLNGGIIGALLDCHSNWTAAWHLMRRAAGVPSEPGSGSPGSEGEERPPCTVTAEFHVKLLRPTPTAGPIKLVARVAESSDDRAVIEAELRAEVATKDGGREEKPCATCRGTFVAVKPGHPAYHRW